MSIAIILFVVAQNKRLKFCGNIRLEKLRIKYYQQLVETFYINSEECKTATYVNLFVTRACLTVSVILASLMLSVKGLMEDNR